MARAVKRTIIPLSLSIVVCIVIALTVSSTCSFADSKRPEHGSIAFGAEKRPEIRLSGPAEAWRTVIADVAEKVVPTVVSVIPTKIDTVVFSNNPFYQFFGGDPFGGFEEFFGQQPKGQRRSAPPPVEKKEYRQQGLGSGVIVSKDGYILTNYHVVAGANEIEIRTADKRSFQASVVGLDSLADIAVIKIREKVKDLPVAFLGNSDRLRPGDWAIAIGNPFSLTSSVTLGIISALKRAAPGNSDSYQNFIQTDAAINPGNSGGALVNIDGELVGINTMIYTQSGGYMGIGFAIPINMARQIMEDLIYEGKVARGWLGVSIQEIDGTTREALNLDGSVRGGPDRRCLQGPAGREGGHQARRYHHGRGRKSGGNPQRPAQCGRRNPSGRKGARRPPAGRPEIDRRGDAFQPGHEKGPCGRRQPGRTGLGGRAVVPHGEAGDQNRHPDRPSVRRTGYRWGHEGGHCPRGAAQFAGRLSGYPAERRHTRGEGAAGHEPEGAAGGPEERQKRRSDTAAPAAGR